MGINRVSKRGKTRIEVRKRWPDGKTYRRYFPNMTKARKTWRQIEGSLADGDWRELRDRLNGIDTESEESTQAQAGDITVSEFAEVYMDRCRVLNRRPDFKKQALVAIRRNLGKLKLSELDRDHGERFVAVRSREVAPATVNRGLAVLKHMLNYAVKKGFIESNPLAGFEKLPEEERALRIMTLEEERRLVQGVASVNPVVGVYTALLGETGLRKTEGLNLKWEHIDLKKRIVTVVKSKTGHPRWVPLSPYAVEWLLTLPRHLKSPWVFARLDDGARWKDPRWIFISGRKKAGLPWVKGFHDLRHFRATMWLQRGVDVHTVQRYLGHRRIETTMRYLHFVPDHAERAVREAQEAELREAKRFGSGRHLGDSRC